MEPEAPTIVENPQRFWSPSLLTVTLALAAVGGGIGAAVSKRRVRGAAVGAAVGVAVFPALALAAVLALGQR